MFWSRLSLPQEERRRTAPGSSSQELASSRDSVVWSWARTTPLFEVRGEIAD